jgi:hypothetical protein
MRNLPQRLLRAGAVFVFSAVACFIAGGAHATCQPPPAWSASGTYNIGDVVAFDVVSSDGTLVSGAFYQSLVDGNTGNVPASSPDQWSGNNILVCKFTVQPIDVCSSDGVICPVINSMGDIAASDTAASNTNLIGSIDPGNPTGSSLDQLAFAQIGVSMAVLPAVRWHSPSNPIGNGPDYGQLNVCSCDTGSSTSCPSLGSCAAGVSSLDLLTITQQPQIAMSTPGNPYTPAFPLNSLHNVNLFFVHFIQPLRGVASSRGSAGRGITGAPSPLTRFFRYSVRVPSPTSSAICSAHPTLTDTRFWELGL